MTLRFHLVSVTPLDLVTLQEHFLANNPEVNYSIVSKKRPREETCEEWWNKIQDLNTT